MQKLILASLVMAASFAAQAPADALGGVCSGRVDRGCKQCYDYRQSPPQPTSASDCTQPNKPPYYGFEDCDYYVLGECI